jgi:hypothetical protein
MIVKQPDNRSEQRKLLDERIAAEPKLPIPQFPSEQQAKPLEWFIGKPPLSDQ